MPRGEQAPTTAPPPASAGLATGPNGYYIPGAWTQANNSWTWTPGASPDPTLVSQWGAEAMSDPTRDPTGVVNHGVWENNTPDGGWQWVWGATPAPGQVGDRDGPPPTTAALTNPNQAPNGYVLPGNPGSPPPPDVVPPTVVDSWNGVAPSVTGTLPPPAAGSTPSQVSQPPSHSPYAVSPGGIRNAENTLLGQVDTQIGDYNNLKAYVAASAGQNLYSEGASREELGNVQDNLLLQIGDAIELAGQFTSMLNYAAQNYANADINSYFPES